MKKNIKIIILLVVFVLVLIFSIVKLSIFFMELASNKKMNDKLIKDVTKVEKVTVDDEEVEKFTVDYDSLLSINKDVRGWIKFNNDKVNYPIVQSTDNYYYAIYNIHKNRSSLGSIFMDYRNHSLKDKNVILFGHNSTDGSMFGSLRDALNDNFFENQENRIIEIIDLDNNTLHYEIFSVYTIIKEEYYITTNFNNNSEYLKFLETIKSRSFKDFNSDLSEVDSILTLSTCDGVGGTNRRLVIHAKLKDN